MELDHLLPHQVDKFIIPEIGEFDDRNVSRLADMLQEIVETEGFKAIMHLIALQYRDVLNKLAWPVAIPENQMNLLKGRLWGLSEILDLPGAVTDRAFVIKERVKKNPTTGGGR